MKTTLSKEYPDELQRSFYTVPVGSRGVITQFGKIVGIQPEGLAVLPPWQQLALFSVRAEQADIDKADGSIF